MSSEQYDSPAVTSQLSESGESVALPRTKSDPDALAHPERTAEVERIPEGGLAGIRAAKAAGICLTARGLSKRYQGTLALSDLSLDLKKGEIFGLMGPNGAGKTTLLRILATLTKPDSGEFTLDGVPHTNARDVRRKIGFTNDVLGVYDDMLVGEYLEFFARASGVELDLVSYAVDETLELVDLLSMKNQPVDGLSRGMKQRLAFSRAIIAKPSLLLLDEPASGLDPLARLELKELLIRMAREGTTVVLSSHVLEDLAEVSHRIGVLRNGILIRTAETKELVKEEGSRRIRLQVSERGAEFFEFLQTRDDVSSLRWDDQDVVFRWVDPTTGGAHAGDPSELLVAVVTAGFKVRSFVEEKASLENAYLHIAEHNKGKVVGMNQRKQFTLTGRNIAALSGVGILFLGVIVCFCSLLPVVLFMSFLFNTLVLGAGLFSSLAQEREKRTIDALRLTQLTSLDILRYKSLRELRSWKVANIAFLVLSGAAALYAGSPMLWALGGAASLACGGLLSIALALAVSTRCETTSSAVVTGWITKGVWLVGLPILDYVLEAVLVLSKDLTFFSYLDPAWVYRTVVSGLIYETSDMTVVGMVFGALGSVIVAYALIRQSASIIDTSFESSATLEDRNRHSVYGKRFAFGLHNNPFMVRELAWQVRTGAGSWPGYAVFVTLFLAPFLYGLAQQQKVHEREPVRVVRESVANPVKSPILTNSNPTEQEIDKDRERGWPTHEPKPDVRYHDHICLSQMMGLPVPTEHRHNRSYNRYDGPQRIVVNASGASTLVSHDQAVNLQSRDLRNQDDNRSSFRSLKRTHLQSELDRGLLTGLLLTLLYLFIRGAAFMSGAVTGEKERRAWDQIALTGATPESYLSGKLLGVLYFPMKQLLYTSPILLLFAAFGGISLVEILLMIPLMLATFMAAANIGLLSTSTRASSHQAQGTALMAVAAVLLTPLMSGGFLMAGLACYFVLSRTMLSAGEKTTAALMTSAWVLVAGASASPASGVLLACEYTGYSSLATLSLHPVASLLIGTISMAMLAWGAYRLSVRTLDQGGSVKA